MTAKDLRSIRLALNFSLAEFGQCLGISEIELDAFERGYAPFDEQQIGCALRRVTLKPSELTSALLQRHY